MGDHSRRSRSRSRSPSRRSRDVDRESRSHHSSSKHHKSHKSRYSDDEDEDRTRKHRRDKDRQETEEERKERKRAKKEKRRSEKDKDDGLDIVDDDDDGAVWVEKGVDADVSVRIPIFALMLRRRKQYPIYPPQTLWRSNHKWNGPKHRYLTRLPLRLNGASEILGCSTREPWRPPLLPHCLPVMSLEVLASLPPV
jgi:hypothetical protein